MLLFLIVLISICILSLIGMITKINDDNSKQILLSNGISSGVIFLIIFYMIYSQDYNALDLIFFYTLLSPIGLISIWIYTKYSKNDEQE